MTTETDGGHRIDLWKNINTLEPEGDKICSEDCDKLATFVSKKQYFCGKHCGKKSDHYSTRTPYKGILVKNLTSAFLVQKALEAIKFLETYVHMNPQTRIELQPKCNPKMKVISHCIFTKCIELFGWKNVKFMRASMKLKGKQCLSESTKSMSGYSQRKKMGEENCLDILSNNNYIVDSEKYVEYFKQSKKKNDLSDTFLMCCNYLKLKGN
jgi:hypothetical protein